VDQTARTVMSWRSPKMQRRPPVKRQAISHSINQAASNSPTRQWSYPREESSADESDDSRNSARSNNSSVKSWNQNAFVQSFAQSSSGSSGQLRRVSMPVQKSSGRRKSVQSPDPPAQLAMSAFSFVTLALFTNFIPNVFATPWLPTWGAVGVIVLSCLTFGFILGSGPVRQMLWAAFGNKETAAVATVLYLLWITSRVLPAVFELLDDMQQRSGALVATPLLLLFLWSASLGVFALGLLIALLFSYDVASATQRALSFATKYLLGR
jgi:hypothetical protein